MDRYLFVDKHGFFIGAFQWKKTRKAITFSQHWKRIPSEYYEEGCENKRWSFKEKRWIAPDKLATVVDGNGQPVMSVKGFEGRMPRVPDGYRVIDGRPPRVRHCRMIWNGTDWQEPDRAEVVDAEGNVVNRIVVGSVLPEVEEGFTLRRVKNDDSDSD